MKLPGIIVLALIVILLLVFIGNRQPRSLGHDLKRGINDAADDVKDIGRDVADSARKIVQ